MIFFLSRIWEAVAGAGETWSGRRGRSRFPMVLARVGMFTRLPIIIEIDEHAVVSTTDTSLKIKIRQLSISHMIDEAPDYYNTTNRY